MWALLAIAALVITSILSAHPASSLAPSGIGGAEDPSQLVVGKERGTRITLITGDVVEVTGSGRSQQARVVETAAREEGIYFGGHEIVRDHSQLWVYPNDARPLLNRGLLDERLFNVSLLLEQGLSDARTDVVPILVDRAKSASALTKAKVDRLPGVDGAAVYPDAGVADAEVEKADAGDFWAALTADAAATDKPDSARSTLAEAGLGHVWLNGKVRATLDESVAQIGGPEAWAAGWTGQGTTVAVLDTGIDPTHPDFEGRIRATESFIPGQTVDGNGHGTHVASTIAGSGAASGGTLRGVAPDAELLIGKVLNNGGGGTEAQIIAGMEWAVEQGADVVNMSLGGTASTTTDPMMTTLERLSGGSDTLFVVAAGNDGPSAMTVGTPGASDAALTVGAVDKAGVLAGFSSRGPAKHTFHIKPDLAAPGVDITAARAAGTAMGTPQGASYTAASGTSMATPHVAGAALLVRQARPELDRDDVYDVLVGSTEPVQQAVANQVGTGSLRVDRAISADVLVDARDAELGVISPTNNKGTITYRNTGEDAVTLALSDTSEAVTLATDRMVLAPGAEGTLSLTVAVPDGVEADLTANVVAEASNGQRIVAAVGGTIGPKNLASLSTTITLPPNLPDGATGLSGTVTAYRQGAPEGSPFTSYQLEVDSGQASTAVLPVGTYTASVTISYLSGDGDMEGVSTSATFAFKVAAGGSALRIPLHRARPHSVATSRAQQMFGWTYHGFLQHRSTQWVEFYNEWSDPFAKLYVVDSATSGFTTFPLPSALHSQHLQPAVTLHLGKKKGLDLGLLYGTGSDHRFLRFEVLPNRTGAATRLVDVGDGSVEAIDTLKLTGAFAVYEFPNASSLSDVATRAKAKGAIALLVMPSRGSDISVSSVRSMTQSLPIATLALTTADATVVRAALGGTGGASATYTSRISPDYVYNLAFGANTGGFRNLPSALTQKQLGTLRLTTPDRAVDMPAGRKGVRVLSAWSGFSNKGPYNLLTGYAGTRAFNVAADSTSIQVYAGPVGSSDLTFQHELPQTIFSGPGGSGALVPFSQAVAHSYPRATSNSVDFGATQPLVPGAVRTPLLSDTVEQNPHRTGCYGCRVGDLLFPDWVYTPPIDQKWFSASNVRNAPNWADKARPYQVTRNVTVDGVPTEGQLFGPGTVCTTLPAACLTGYAVPEDAQVQVHDVWHQGEFLPRHAALPSTKVDSRWTFESRRPRPADDLQDNRCGTRSQAFVPLDGACAAVAAPLLAYDLPSEFRAGRNFTAEVETYHDDGVVNPPKVATLSAWVSTNSGSSWQRLTVRRLDGGHFKLVGRLARSLSANTPISLRVVTHDRADSSLDQRLIDIAVARGR